MIRERGNNRHRPEKNHPALCHLVPDNATTIDKPDQVPDLVDPFLENTLLSTPMNQYNFMDQPVFW
jgi:hypothetical protein